MGPRSEPGGLIGRTLLALVLLTLVAGPFTALPVAAQEGAERVNVELILDASGSMAQRIGGETRMTIAKRVLHDVIAAIPEREGVNVGFRLYGHRGDNSAAGKAVSCRSSELLVPIDGVDKAALDDAVDGARATGWTPLASSIRRAIADFPDAERGVVNAVVLVTDGLETCGGDPCAAAAEAAASDVELTTHVVSFAQSTEERAILECIADAGDGLLLGADDADELAAALFQILEELEIVDSTGILEIEAFGDVWPAATATCAGRISDSDPQGERVTVRFTDTNRAEVPVGACDLAWRNPSGTTTRLRVAIEPGRVTWVRGSLLELPQGAGETYAIADAAGLVVWEAPVEAFDRVWLLPGLYRIELAERVGDPVLRFIEAQTLPGHMTTIDVTTSNSTEIPEDADPTTVRPTPPPGDSVSNVLTRVPDLLGLRAAQAVDVARRAGLRLTFTTVPTDEALPGTVIAQDPRSGELAFRGEDVAVLISGTPDLVAVPDVTEMTEEDADALLEASDLEGGEVSTVSSSRVPSGRVIATDPEAGDLVEPGSDVDYTVSAGLELAPSPTPSPSPEPSTIPSIEPSSVPTAEPTPVPTVEPTPVPTAEPAPVPTVEPTVEPTLVPTVEPTPEPTAESTVEPTLFPTAEPTPVPTVEPTAEPTPVPTAEPTPVPTAEPTPVPTAEPTPVPTAEPTPVPTAEPTPVPTAEPTPVPTAEPTPVPTAEPTLEPTSIPSPTALLLTVPDVAGLPEFDAVAALEATGLVVDERVERPHRRIPAGTVIRTRPDAGEVVDPGTPVELVVSIGQPATPSPALTPTPEAVVTVPDVTGLAESDAAAQLESVGLTVGDRVARENERFVPGAVIRTRPEAGQAVDPGTAIDLIVSLGLPATPSPLPPASPTPVPVPSPVLTPAASPIASLVPASPAPVADDLLARVQAAGVLRTNIRPDDPGWSVQRPNGQVRGYSTQVAGRIAEALGIDIAFTTEPLEDVVAGGWADRWDISFDHLVATDPSVGALALSQPYAWEPVTFAAGPESGVNADDMTGLAVCVVVGSIAERWLAGTIGLVDAAGGQAVPPAVGSLVQAGSDEDCLAAVRDGSAQGWAASATTIEAAIADGAPLVTATTTAGWAPIVAAVDPTVPGHESLLAAVDATITALRDDGTLSQLSERAFGTDLSSPPSGLAPVAATPEEAPDA